MTNTTMNMEIRMQGNIAQTTLRIPKAQLKWLAEREVNGDESDNTTATAGSFTRTQTIVSGAFLSLALVFGGMWFVSSGKSATKKGRMLVILAVVGVVSSAATLIYANVGPPQQMRSITTKLFDKKSFEGWNYASGPIRVETSPDDVIELIVADPPSEPKAEE